MLRKIIIGIVLITAYFFAMPDNMRNYVKAKVGSAEAQYNLGMLYRQEDHRQAVDWLTKSGNQGFAKAQQELGSIYQNGAGVVKQDYKQAFNWYAAAARQGLPYAQRSVGSMYYNGEGVPKNNELAIHWFTKAAEQGDDPSQVVLGYAYETGEAVTKDLKKAYMWFAVHAASNPSSAYMDRVSSSLTPAEIEEAQAEAAMLIKKIEINKSHKK